MDKSAFVFHCISVDLVVGKIKRHDVRTVNVFSWFLSSAWLLKASQFLSEGQLAQDAVLGVSNCTAMANLVARVIC